ncbi:DRE4 protein [Giardia muris]|uniref:FACT complex subunit n=1 Tax=Giardia muris TaxID=5742 RepID=A0A4Z1T8R1_GIAMU|nr:DRE4 protein [Giardia muris]|eukprot:TNJ30513.1 DRE4 protein [Giardia muris]
MDAVHRPAVYRAAAKELFCLWEDLSFDALWVYQTSEFMVANPTSATAAFLRGVTGSDTKGVPVLFVRATRTVVFVPISEKSFTAFSKLDGEEDGITTRVIRMEKGKPPPGVMAVLQTLEDGKAMSLGMVVKDIDILTTMGNKLMDELFGQLGKRPGFKAREDASTLVFRFILGASHPESLKIAGNMALNYYQRLASNVERAFNNGSYLETSRSVKLESVLNSTYGANSAEVPGFKGSAEKYYQLTDQQLAILHKDNLTGAFCSIVSTATTDYLSNSSSDSVYRALNASRKGYSCVTDLSSIMADGEKFSALAVVSSASAAGSAALIARTIVSGRPMITQVARSALEEVEKAHQLVVDVVTHGLTFTELSTAIKTARNGCPGTITCSRTKKEINITYDQTHLGAVCGMSLGSGIGINSDVRTLFAKTTHLPLCFTFPDTGAYIVKETTPLFVHTLAHVIIPDLKMAFDILYGDTIVPAFQETGAVITSPIYTCNSPHECLRSVFLVRSYEKRTNLSSNLQPQASGNSDTSESSNESTDERVVNAKQQRKERQLKIQEMRVHQAKLETELQQRLRNRFEQGWQLMRKEGNMRAVLISHNSVEEYPSGIYPELNIVSKDTKNKKLFIAVNGRAVPIHPTMVHSVKSAGSRGDNTLVHIQLVAPGTVSGKAKEHFPQLEKYGHRCTFLKEIVLECPKTEAEHIVTQLTDHLQKARTEHMQQTTEAVQVDIDIDRHMSPELRAAITAPEQLVINLPTSPNFFSISQQQLGQPLTLRPMLFKRKESEGGELYVHQNGIRYRFPSTAGHSIYLDLLYKNIKSCFFEKLCDASHIAILYFMFRTPMTIKQLITGGTPNDADEGVLSKMHLGISFVCNFETTLQLRGNAAHDDIDRERALFQHMQKANRVYKNFLDRMKDAINEYELNKPIFKGQLFMVCNRDKRDLHFSASYQGNHVFYCYKNHYIGFLEQRTQFMICMDDIDLVAFENVDLYRGSTFHITFVYKDIRLDPVTINSIQSRYINDIQEWVDSVGVKYFVYENTTKWRDVIPRLFNTSEDYKNFLDNGGWTTFFKDDEEEESSDASESEGFKESGGSYSDEEDSFSEYVSSEEDNLTQDMDLESDLVDFDRESESDRPARRRR